MTAETGGYENPIGWISPNEYDADSARRLTPEEVGAGGNVRGRFIRRNPHSGLSINAYEHRVEFVTLRKDKDIAWLRLTILAQGREPAEVLMNVDGLLMLNNEYTEGYLLRDEDSLNSPLPTPPLEGKARQLADSGALA